MPYGSGIGDPTDVTFEYDALGNRTLMADGLGTVAYTYDSLSRATSEARDFTDELADEPTGGLFTLSYEYTLTALKSYTDPYGETINYARQKNGRLGDITGSTFAGVTNYANNPEYRAWGTLKHLEYGSGKQMDVSYDERLRPESSEVSSLATPTEKPLDRDYEYYADGRLKFVDDRLETSVTFDRLFTFDHAGRVKVAKSGIEASGQTQTNRSLLPYRQTYNYDPFGNITGRVSTMWNYPGDWDFNYSVTNNRASGSDYDSDGRERHSSSSPWFEYDAAGAMVKTWRGYSTYTAYETYLYHDGDERERKRTQRTWDPELSQWEDWEINYSVGSSVLGGIVTEVGATGKKKRTYVFWDGVVIARQSVNSSNQEGIGWKYTEASGLGTRSDATGAGGWFTSEELDALGNNVGTRAAPPPPPNRRGNATSYGSGFVFESTDWGDCELDGIMSPCSMVNRAMQMGAVQAQAMYHSEKHGFRQHAKDFDQSLPGRGSMSIWLLDSVRTSTNVSRIENAEDTTVSLPEIQTYSTGQWIAFDSSQIQSTAQQLLDIAIGDALEALKKPQCRNVFGTGVDAEMELLGYSDYPSPTLGSITLGDLGGFTDVRNRQGNVVGRTSTAARTTAIFGSFLNSNGIPVSRTDGAEIVVNSNINGPFVGGFSDYLGLGLTDRVYRAITIIHELGHALRFRFGARESPIVYDVGPGTEGYSRRNSDLIYAACFAR